VKFPFKLSIPFRVLSPSDNLGNLLFARPTIPMAVSDRVLIQKIRKREEAESGETCSTTVTGMRWRACERWFLINLNNLEIHEVL
jgi:hypothetical protein